MKNTNGLEGEIAVVTGASRGIGRAISIQLLAMGAVVMGCGRNAKTKDLPEEIHWTVADVSKREDVQTLLRRALKLSGRLSVLVNNAGVQVEKTVTGTTDEEWEQVIGTNCRGVFNTCREFIPAFEQLGGGTIVNLGSISGETADPGLALYDASKGFVHALTRAIAIDHGPGIRCNAVCPGWIMTDMAEAAFAAAREPRLAQRDAIRRHPANRLGTPEDVAKLVAWLVTKNAEFVTGQCIRVDGGLSSACSIRPEFF